MLAVRELGGLDRRDAVHRIGAEGHGDRHEQSSHQQHEGGVGIIGQRAGQSAGGDDGVSLVKRVVHALHVNPDLRHFHVCTRVRRRFDLRGVRFPVVLGGAGNDRGRLGVEVAAEAEIAIRLQNDRADVRFQVEQAGFGQVRQQHFQGGRLRQVISELYAIGLAVNVGGGAQDFAVIVAFEPFFAIEVFVEVVVLLLTDGRRPFETVAEVFEFRARGLVSAAFGGAEARQAVVGQALETFRRIVGRATERDRQASLLQGGGDRGHLLGPEPLQDLDVEHHVGRSAEQVALQLAAGGGIVVDAD